MFCVSGNFPVIKKEKERNVEKIQKQSILPCSSSFQQVFSADF